jgi:hypothetical protein
METTIPFPGGGRKGENAMSFFGFLVHEEVTTSVRSKSSKSKASNIRKSEERWFNFQTDSSIVC